jgi:hypothetical protein
MLLAKLQRATTQFVKLGSGLPTTILIRSFPRLFADAAKLVEKASYRALGDLQVTSDLRRGLPGLRTSPNGFPNGRSKSAWHDRVLSPKSCKEVQTLIHATALPEKRPNYMSGFRPNYMSGLLDKLYVG